MVEEVIMPKLGATMEKGTILTWLKSEGEQVEKGEPLVEIMTDKINMEIEATSSGILLKKCYGTDTEVEVLKPIAYIGEEGENIPGFEASEVKKVEQPEQSANLANELPGIRPRRTPAARRLAEKYGIDLQEVEGTGPNGRIQRKDIELFHQQRQKAGFLSEKQIINPDKKVVKGISYLDDGSNKEPQGKQTIDYAGMRKIIGERMSHSVQNVPQVTLHCEVDMSEVIAFREKLLPMIEKKAGVRLSYTDIFTKFVAHTLCRYPVLNASLKGEKIVMHERVHIGIAVDIPQGLIVPVIKDADKKSLTEIAKESKKLIQRAHKNELSYEQITGGTFSISNLGMLAVDSFNPIINEPEVAILGIGRIRDQFIQKEGSIEITKQVTLNLTFDHRVLDGAVAGRFLTDLKNLLENPYYLFV